MAADYFTHSERRGSNASGTWPVLEAPKNRFVKEAKEDMTVVEGEMTAETRKLFEEAYAAQLEAATRNER